MSEPMMLGEINIVWLCERAPVGRYTTADGYVFTVTRAGIQFGTNRGQVTIAIEWCATRLDGTRERPRALATVMRSYGELNGCVLHTRTMWFSWAHSPSGDVMIFERGLRVARMIHLELERTT